MNCDPIASTYRFFEYAVFGHRLEEHRRHFLTHIPERGSVLVLGDGDGRFLQELVLSRPVLHIDVLELSEKMLALSRKRIRSITSVDSERICLKQADAMQAQLPEGQYGAVVAHFFLDCFSDAAVWELLSKLKRSSRPGAIFILSEFHLPEKGWKRWHANVWLATMYLFFRIATGLSTQKLPSYRSLLEQQGWSMLERYSSRAALISSEVWSLEPSQSAEIPCCRPS